MINFLLNENVLVKRRKDISVASRDDFNNPIYGAPTSSWTTVYASMPCRLAFSGTPIEFAMIGERIKPQGAMYAPVEFVCQQEDRVLTGGGIEYVITSVQKAYMTSNVLSHYEYTLELP
jgi:hypothetical protein